MLYSKSSVIEGLKQKQDYFISFYFNRWKKIMYWNASYFNLQAWEHDKIFLLQVISNNIVFKFHITKFKS